MKERPPAELRRGDRLPPLLLPRAADGAPVDLNSASRDARLLLIVAGDDAGAAAALEPIADAARDIEHWYARLFVVATGSADAARRLDDRLGSRLSVLNDADEAAARRLGLAGGGAALFVADRYGQIYEVAGAPSAAGLPAASELEEWAKFLATQCPECGVIDEPGHGEWSAD
jgi:hypothetical protein